MERFEYLPTPLDGLVCVARRKLEDNRGFLSRLYCADEFRRAGVPMPVAQINQTLTKAAGSLRGMHFQRPPFAEAKLVSCLKGEIFDVAVDLRRGSPTFLNWHAEILSAENQRGLYIPQGFAHGFQTLCDDCELVYLHSVSYQPEAEGALNALDPRLGISWPLPVADMSARDRAHAMLSSDFRGIDI